METTLDRVQALCKNRNITIAALERTCGLGNGTIKKWDNSTPSGDKLAKVADYFNVSVDYLLGRETIEKTKTTTIEGLDNPLTEEELNAVYAFIESYRKFQRDLKDKR